MKSLNESWLTDGWMDFEYKKYILLAYLKSVEKHFKEHKLFPALADMIQHYRDLISLDETKKITKEAFPKIARKIDFDQLKFVYENTFSDDQVISVLEEILEFAIPRIQKGVDNGKEIYEFFQSGIMLEPVGLVPIYKKEGYILLYEPSEKHTDVYQYQISFIENKHEKFESVNTKYITNYPRKIHFTYEYIKSDLIKNKKDLPNPCTFVAESKYAVPRKETFLPITKRSIAEYLTEKN
ncbi:MAG: hypothetical protein EA412_07710 [Chitinophagaceae bacterium]|nr:MAG: hypothetical protein EA412_07710 [Chitinophagaceae bacterium]